MGDKDNKFWKFLPILNKKVTGAIIPTRFKFLNIPRALQEHCVQYGQINNLALGKMQSYIIAYKLFNIT